MTKKKLRDGTVDSKFAQCRIYGNFTSYRKNFLKSNSRLYTHSKNVLHVETRCHGVVMRRPRKYGCWPIFRWQL